MKRFVAAALLLAALVIAVPVNADPGILYVDDDGVCGGNAPCYTHPQDAVTVSYTHLTLPTIYSV